MQSFDIWKLVCSSGTCRSCNTNVQEGGFPGRRRLPKDPGQKPLFATLEPGASTPDELHAFPEVWAGIRTLRL